MRNLASAVLNHLREADKGKGPLAGWVRKDDAGLVILAYHKSFGLGCAFTYEELYDFIHQTIFKQTTHPELPERLPLHRQERHPHGHQAVSGEEEPADEPGRHGQARLLRPGRHNDRAADQPRA